jgi:hypothetical protein
VARLYVSQEQMDQWTTGGKVALEDDLMTVAALGRTFRIETAVRVVALVGGDDTAKLVGKVKTQGQLAESGYERYGNSLVAGDAAYECEEGFVGTPTDAPSVSGSGLLDLGK